MANYKKQKQTVKKDQEMAKMKIEAITDLSEAFPNINERIDNPFPETPESITPKNVITSAQIIEDNGQTRKVNINRPIEVRKPEITKFNDVDREVEVTTATALGKYEMTIYRR